MFPNRSPYHPNTQVVKRVIALEGDKVITRSPYPQPIAEVPPGHVWVEGDGGSQTSLDSNHYGPIAQSLIIGRVTHVLWPWSSFGPIRWWEFKGKTKVLQAGTERRLEWI
jgi:inner membrane protease subunit 2